MRVKLELPASPTEDWGRYRLWHVAPVTCAGEGWALLGELDKIVPVRVVRLSVGTMCPILSSHPIGCMRLSV